MQRQRGGCSGQQHRAQELTCCDAAVQRPRGGTTGLVAAAPLLGTLMIAACARVWARTVLQDHPRRLRDGALPRQVVGDELHGAASDPRPVGCQCHEEDGRWLPHRVAVALVDQVARVVLRVVPVGRVCGGGAGGCRHACACVRHGEHAACWLHLNRDDTRPVVLALLPSLRFSSSPTPRLAGPRAHAPMFPIPGVWTSGSPMSL